MPILDKFSISEGEDSFVWVLEKSGQYTTRFIYRKLAFRWVVNRRMVKPWKNKMPMKLTAFMWLVINNCELQTGANLMKKDVEGVVVNVVYVGSLKMKITFSLGVFW